MLSHDVPRVDRPTREELRRRVSTERTPFVLTGVLTQWPAYQRWTDEYLAKVSGHAMVHARVTDQPLVRLEPDAEKDAVKRMTLAEYLALKPKQEGRFALMHDIRLQTLYGLAADVGDPDFADRSELAMCTVGHNHGGGTTPIHFDFFDNALCLLRGTKKVTVFPAAEWSKLYFHSPFSGSPHVSQAHEIGDLERFPNLRETTRYEVELKGGEILYIPAFWPHHVETPEPTTSMNFWWQTPLRHWLTPQGMSVQTLFARDLGNTALGFLRGHPVLRHALPRAVREAQH